MSKDITKKQHYVWRKYLGAWKNHPEDKDIWTGFLQTKEVKKVAMMSVAQSSYFYRLEELTDDELNFLRQTVGQMPEKTRELAQLLFAGYVLYSQQKRAIAAKQIKLDADTEHKLNKIGLSSLEAVQAGIERMGADFIECTSIDDFKKLWEQEYEILCFIWVQYLRTRAMKDRFVKSLSEKPNIQAIGQKCWPFYNIAYAMQLVEVMYHKQDYRFVFIHNKSRIPFITGDQPVINAFGNKTDEKREVLDIEVYYPLSPVSAFVVAFTKGEKYCEVNVDESYVKERNSLIAEESEIHIFSNDENLLKEQM